MIAAFSITPLGVGDSVSAGVADAVRLVRESGLANETNRHAFGLDLQIDDQFR